MIVLGTVGGGGDGDVDNLLEEVLGGVMMSGSNDDVARCDECGSALW